MHRILTLALIVATGGVAAAQSPAPSSSPSASPSASPASGAFAPHTKLVTTCRPYTNLRSQPIADPQSIAKDSNGASIVLKPDTELEVMAGGTNASAFVYVQAPSRDGSTNGYVARPCIKLAT